ncbi:MAG: thiamine-phosphate kinase [Chloroflexi bacterium]|nr:thiamine-phosphate kinase [Chloroflexota bacterium]
MRLIEALARICPPLPEGVLVGIGDDAALWRADGLALATTDSLISGVHFIPGQISYYELGWKAMAVNLSDIAAMGGVPQYALVTLALPPEMEVETVEDLYRGLAELASRFDTAIVGGNVSASPGPTMVTVTVFGRLPEPKGPSAGKAPAMLRSAAQPGDVIAVTGWLGGSAAGMRVLQGQASLPAEEGRQLRALHVMPTPRVHEGQLLLQQGVRCAIDISDGLIRDLRHILQASGVGARCYSDRLPVHPVVKARWPEKALHLALTGGEDYELLFTASAEIVEQIRGRQAAKGGIPVTAIGEIVAGDRLVLIGTDGNETPPDDGGYDHFRH